MGTIKYALYCEDHIKACTYKRLFRTSWLNMNFRYKVHTPSILPEALRSEEPQLLIVLYPFEHFRQQQIMDEVRKISAKLRVLFITGRKDKRYVLDLMSRGANGIAHGNDAEEFFRSIAGVMEHEILYNTLFTEEMYYEMLNRKREEKNSPRKFRVNKNKIEILKLLDKDMKHKTIGDKLGLETHTVDVYVSEMLHDAECNTSVGLVRYAKRNGIIPDGEVS